MVCFAMVPGIPLTMLVGSLRTMTIPAPATTTTGEVLAAKTPETVGRSPGQLMWLRFRRDRTGIVSAVVVIFFFLVALLAPVIAWLYGKDPTPCTARTCRAC